MEDNLARIYRAAARAYCLAQFSYEERHYQAPAAREQHIANDVETYLSEKTRDKWFRPTINAAIAEYRRQRRGRKKKGMYEDRLLQLREQLKATELERDKWRLATIALGDDNRAQQWLAMHDVVTAAEPVANVFHDVFMVFSRQSGKTAIGNVLLPLLQALARYHHGPDAEVIRLGKE